MRSSTVAIIAIAASAAPVLAVPFHPGSVHNHRFGQAPPSQPLEVRDYDELYAREVATAAPHPDAQSGALNFKSILKGAGKVASLFIRDDLELREDDFELLARDDDIQILARAVATPPTAQNTESGALNFKSILKGAGKVASLFIRDDLEARDNLEAELVARAVGAPDAQSGALNFKSILKGAGKVASLFLRDELEARNLEDFELLARATPPDGQAQSGALNFKSILKGAGKVASLFIRDDLELRDDEMEILRRAAAQDAQSGALNFKSILKGAGKVASLFIREDLESRNEDLELRDEDIELLRRAVAAHPDATQSGALNFKSILKGAGKVASLFLRDDELQLRDDEFEILKRAADTPQSGALNFKSILKGAGKVASLFIRDDLEAREDESDILLARAVAAAQGAPGAHPQESGALNFKSILKGAGKVASLFIREDLEARDDLDVYARSLNELD